MASLVTLSQNDNWVEGETEVMETKTQTNHMTVNTWGGRQGMRFALVVGVRTRGSRAGRNDWCGVM